MGAFGDEINDAGRKPVPYSVFHREEIPRMRGNPQ